MVVAGVPVVLVLPDRVRGSRRRVRRAEAVLRARAARRGRAARPARVDRRVPAARRARRGPTARRRGHRAKGRAAGDRVRGTGVARRATVAHGPRAAGVAARRRPTAQGAVARRAVRAIARPVAPAAVVRMRRRAPLPIRPGGSWHAVAQSGSMIPRPPRASVGEGARRGRPVPGVRRWTRPVRSGEPATVRPIAPGTRVTSGRSIRADVRPPRRVTANAAVRSRGAPRSGSMSMRSRTKRPVR